MDRTRHPQEKDFRYPVDRRLWEGLTAGGWEKNRLPVRGFESQLPETVWKRKRRFTKKKFQ